MLIKANEDKKILYLCLLEYENTPKSKYLPSPSEILMGRKVNGLLPTEEEKEKYIKIKEKLMELKN